MFAASEICSALSLNSSLSFQTQVLSHHHAIKRNFWNFYYWFNNNIGNSHFWCARYIQTESAGAGISTSTGNNIHQIITCIPFTLINWEGTIQLMKLCLYTFNIRSRLIIRSSLFLLQSEFESNIFIQTYQCLQMLEVEWNVETNTFLLTL